jgi:hypothetical protein
MSKIKLAEAILQRGDLQKFIEQLKVRLNNNTLRQDKTKTPEKPEDILKEVYMSYSRLEFLINVINEANNKTEMYKLLNKREIIKSKLSVLRNFLTNLSSGVNRYSKTEIAILPNYEPVKVQKEIDQLAKEFRLVDNQIQSQNWLIEVEV